MSEPITRIQCKHCGLWLLPRYLDAQQVCTACVRDRTGPRRIRISGLVMTTDDYDPTRGRDEE